jgi:hypothetical protein
MWGYSSAPGPGARGLVPHRSSKPGAVDDQNQKIVGVAVEEFGHAAELVAQRAVDEALIFQGYAAGGHSVLTRSRALQPGRALGDMQQLGHSVTLVAELTNHVCQLAAATAETSSPGHTAIGRSREKIS